MKKSDLIKQLAAEISADGDSSLLKYSYTEGEMTTSYHRHSLTRKDSDGKPRPMTVSEYIKIFNNESDE